MICNIPQKGVYMELVSLSLRISRGFIALLVSGFHVSGFIAESSGPFQFMQILLTFPESLGGWRSELFFRTPTHALVLRIRGSAGLPAIEIDGPYDFQ